jgi:glutamine amidotransferase
MVQMDTRTAPLPVVAIDYGAGNLRSVVRALAHIGADVTATADPEAVRRARALVFPGVGATRDTMNSLRRLGLDVAIREQVRAGTPLLGICVGMQVLCERSDEFGEHACLGIVDGHVRRLPPGQKVPQIGWNQVTYRNRAGEHPLFAGIAEGTDFYFVHSYYCDLSDPGIVAATTEYGLAFPSALLRDNLAAVQFHPEKSGACGLRLLANFVNWAAAQP